MTMGLEQQSYKNFEVAVYITTIDMRLVDDFQQFKDLFDELRGYVHIGKVYIESHRSGDLISEAELIKYKTYFESIHIKVAAGVTLNTHKKDRFTSFCYSTELAQVEKIINYTAKIFDEIILDDFFFDNCKCNHCIEGRGNQSWSDYRNKRMASVSEGMITSAKKVNPKVQMTIKFPNWYESYHELGYNLEAAPRQFDYLYAGNETRDTKTTQQNLHAYESYFISRYLENIAPGRVKGGWFDTFDCDSDVMRYMEQLYLTLLAGAKEITLFAFSSMTREQEMFTAMAGYGFKRMDKILSKLKNPVGLATYKPYHSSGDQYLQSLMGMIGINVECYSEFPKEAETIFLTASASKDVAVTQKIQCKLMDGATVVITTGLLERLQKTQNFDLIQVEVVGQVAVDKIGAVPSVAGFKSYTSLTKPIMIPRIDYHTNDVWEDLVGFNGDNNHPLLLKSYYGKGALYVLNVPCNQSDLKKLPAEGLKVIRDVFLGKGDITFDGPSDIAMMIYEGGYMVLDSFMSNAQDITLRIDGPVTKLKNIETGKTIHPESKGTTTNYSINLRPRKMIVLKLERG